jgi:hypothetical protein
MSDGGGQRGQKGRDHARILEADRQARRNKAEAQCCLVGIGQRAQQQVAERRQADEDGGCRQRKAVSGRAAAQMNSSFLIE